MRVVKRTDVLVALGFASITLASYYHCFVLPLLRITLASYYPCFVLPLNAWVDLTTFS